MVNYRDSARWNPSNCELPFERKMCVIFTSKISMGTRGKKIDTKQGIVEIVVKTDDQLDDEWRWVEIFEK